MLHRADSRVLVCGLPIITCDVKIKMKKLVSIIIPAYNAEKWVGACIESAIAQTWNWKEIVVVDDGSTDSTLKIAESYASPIVDVVTKENGGASSARNLGLSLSQGEYVQWLDADDLLGPTKIERQMEDAEAGQNPTVLFSGPWGRFYKYPEKAIYTSDLLWEDLDPLEWLLRKIENNLWMPPMVFLVSRRLTDMAGLWNENLSLDDDGEYFLRVMSHSSKIRYIPVAQCFKRSTFGLSHGINLTNKKLNSQVCSIFSYIRIVRSIDDSERIRKACLTFLNRWAIYFYPQRHDIMEQMQKLALELGGMIEKPTLSKKYRCIQKIFGWNIAKKAQFALPTARHFARKHLESFNKKHYREEKIRQQ
jgi:glycosyltransferase involved in cell wall biosynthesis